MEDYDTLEQQRINALENLNLGVPATFGGIIRQRPEGDGKTFVQFTGHTIPDVTSRTHIVAVCGITDFEDRACPTEDGWFFSDFYLFHRLFQGLGTSQHWITSEEPKDLLRKYHEYLHGNPHKTRKIVLDDKAISNGKLGEVSIFPREKIKSNFLRILNLECRSAETTGDPILVLIFGHGDEETSGITIGLGNLRKLTISNIQSAIGNPSLNVSLVCTSCYSGGWSISPKLDITTLTAAGEGSKSISWNASKTVGRMCGSIWTSAMVLALLDDRAVDKPSAVSVEDIIPEEASDEQLQTYSSFCGTVFQHLFSRVDRYAPRHGITFSAQNDEWEMFWADRVGLPLVDYKERYDDLEDYPISYLEHPETNLDVEMPRLFDGTETSVSQSEEALRRFEEHQELSLELPRHAYGSGESPSVPAKRTFSGAFGGTIRSFRNQVANIAKDYLDSFPGYDYYGGNVAIHSVAKRCIKGEINNPVKLMWLLRCLEFRNGLSLLGDQFVDFACPTRRLPSCAQWNPKVLPGTADGVKISEAEYNKLVLTIYKLGLFPGPIEEQGTSWTKPADYLAAELLAAGFIGEQLKQKLEDLIALRKNLMLGVRDKLANEPSVRSKRHKVAQAFGKVLRSFSPTRSNRRLLGKSLGKVESLGSPPTTFKATESSG